jgi:hypothetical protein
MYYILEIFWVLKRRATIPYIKSGDGRREALQKGEPALTAGELNYQIFYYVKHNYHITNTTEGELDFQSNIIRFIINFLGDKPNYQKYNDMTGALIRCAKELTRRLQINLNSTLLGLMNNYDDEIAKYEDLKILENGDVE